MMGETPPMWKAELCKYRFFQPGGMPGPRGSGPPPQWLGVSFRGGWGTGGTKGKPYRTEPSCGLRVRLGWCPPGSRSQCNSAHSIAEMRGLQKVHSKQDPQAQSWHSLTLAKYVES